MPYRDGSEREDKVGPGGQQEIGGGGGQDFDPVGQMVVTAAAVEQAAVAVGPMGEQRHPLRWIKTGATWAV